MRTIVASARAVTQTINCRVEDGRAPLLSVRCHNGLTLISVRNLMVVPMIRASRRISVITVTWRRSAVSCGATGAGVIVAGSGMPFSSAVAAAADADDRAPQRQSFRGLDRSERRALKNRSYHQRKTWRTRTCRVFRASLQFVAVAAPCVFNASGAAHRKSITPADKLWPPRGKRPCASTKGAIYQLV